MNAIHSFWFAALSAPVMIANSPFAAQQARRLVGQRVGDALGRRLIDEEVAGVGLGVGVPGQHADAPFTRLAQHGGDAGPVLDGARAIASTLRVIQFSTSSFCFAASRPVGPSHTRSTSSSRAASSAPARQLTK